MLTRAEQTEAQRHAAEMIRRAGIAITDAEANSIEERMQNGKLV